MQIEPIVTFKGIEPSAAMEQNILGKIAEMEKLFSRLISCRVVVSQTFKRGTQGHLFDVHLELTLPGQDIWVSRDSGQNHAHEDAYVAIRDTFAAARRMLEDHVGKLDDHRPAPQSPITNGVIDRLYDDAGYGFIMSDNGEDVYFNKDALAKPNWQDLFARQRVRFKQHEGENGLYAKQVTIADD